MKIWSYTPDFTRKYGVVFYNFIISMFHFPTIFFTDIRYSREAMISDVLLSI